MKPEVWPVKRPFVVFMIPAEHATDYAITMSTILTNVAADLQLDPDNVDTLGLIAATAQHGTEGIFFLEEMGVDTRSVTLLILWGETADAVNFGDAVPEECGLGAVILTETGAVIPTVRMPSLNGDWWDDPVHREYAEIVLSNLMRDGRPELDGSEPYVFVSGHHIWN